jgi:hypothetical protein
MEVKMLDVQTLAALCIYNERPSFWVNVYKVMTEEHKIAPEVALQQIDSASAHILAGSGLDSWLIHPSAPLAI